MTKKRVVNKKRSVAKKITRKTPKKIVHRITPIKRTITPRITAEESNTERILIENFVSLQKVMVNQSVKFDNLSNQISRLLDLFEISAKALAKKGVNMEGDKELIGKIDSLLEQNKVLARGVVLMHEGGSRQELQPSITQKPQPPRFSQPILQQRKTIEQPQDIRDVQEQSTSKFKPLPEE